MFKFVQIIIKRILSYYLARHCKEILSKHQLGLWAYIIRTLAAENEEIFIMLKKSTISFENSTLVTSNILLTITKQFIN